MAEQLEIHVTAGDRAEAERIVEAAVTSRAAAGAQISGPISSTYWWQGKIERSEEFLVLMKTSKARLDDLVRIVKEAHSYDTPEIVAVPIEGGLADYLGWISEETAARPEAG
ncbi:divalent-cation tolerance protein CutA [Actinocorallia aurea]|uniref:divalent-cation tolerance protein CutA n=1 Tax=Actinocorallia sp. A-T 12471 TaxID=3089813 RepID=UPI0029D3B148|nr:divalent-cation tolerance protein CutA [Actinocorallia sp. A-T 12471]MDX6742928.1 divalent-cation tolerance protein CutA [Actinocorallia sp. A-T 12471]